MDGKTLMSIAEKARKTAYAPYSNYKVGCALLASDGKVYTGINIENSAFTPTNCAERTAIFKAVSDGQTKFDAIAICGGKADTIEFCAPCGVCRQVMSEFCSADFKVYLTDGKEIKEYSFSSLFPLAFSLDKE